MSESVIDLQKQFYSTQVPVQTVPTVCVDYDNFSVQNQFNTQLINSIIDPCLQANKVPMFVFNDAANKVGIVSDKLHAKQVLMYGVPANEVYNANADSAVVNMLQYSGWFNKEKSLMTEIAETQWSKQNFSDTYKSTPTRDKILFTDYLLESAVCYVEVFRDGTVDKFLATRNINLLFQLCTAYKNAEKKEPYLRVNKDLAVLANRTSLCKYLAFTRTQIENGELPYIKLATPTKKTKTYNIVMPRGALAQLNANMQYRITPAFLLMRQTNWLRKLLRTNVVEMTYVKDSLKLREITTTLNRTALIELTNNDVERADSYIKTFDTTTEMSASYKVPDLALINDNNTLRVINTRICKLKTISLVDYTNPYANVDVLRVADVFKLYLKVNAENLTALQQYTVFMALMAYKKMFDQSQAEIKHYNIMSQKSQNAEAHKQMVLYITKEIQDKVNTVRVATMRNIAGKSAAELYVMLLAQVNTCVQEGTVAYCKQLDAEMQKYANLFPDYKQVMLSMCQTAVCSTA